MEKNLEKEIEMKNKEDILGSNSPITEFKKVSCNDKMFCTLEDGTKRVVSIDSGLQLFYDKMEMNPETKVDFGRQIKDKIVVLPFQNKILYIDGVTGKQKKTLPIDSNLIYSETDSITGKIKEFNAKLNPAILSILADDKIAQNDYINATGNIDIIYDFEEKSDKIKQNKANKKIAKRMNEYYKSEKEYVQELQVERELSKKIGYVNMLDKMQTSFEKMKENRENEKNKNDIKYLDDECVEYIKKKRERDEMLKSLSDSANAPTNTQFTPVMAKDDEALSCTQKNRKKLVEDLRNYQEPVNEQPQKPINVQNLKNKTINYNGAHTNGWDR